MQRTWIEALEQTGEFMTPGEVELYTDIVKIGVPAVLGFLAGTFPYIIERRKESAQLLQEQIFQ